MLNNTILKSLLVSAAILTAATIVGAQQAYAGSVKKIEVTDGGFGAFTCSFADVKDDIASSRAFGTARIDMQLVVNKETGKMTGTWEIHDIFFDETVARGQITDGKIKDGVFKLTGRETFAINSDETTNCGPTPIPISIVGQCGENVTLTFKGERQDFASAQTQTAAFGGLNISCQK